MKCGYLKNWAMAVMLLLSHAAGGSASAYYPWLPDQAGRHSLLQGIAPPSGYERIIQTGWSFGSWLRGLPLREPGSTVRLFDGREKSYQGGAFAVLDIDVGSGDLQQCADAVIRLRAEYLLQAGCADHIAFDFTSGHRARWPDWRAGYRPVVSGNKVSWIHRGSTDSSYSSFRAYLNCIFTYAGSFSLSRELDVVADPLTVLPGDVFIQGGFPGHAVLVADVVQNKHGERKFLLVQSYMPAQDIHVLRNLTGRESPWYPALRKGTLETPEWTFSYSDLRSFPEPDCNEGNDNGTLPNNTMQRTGPTAPRR
jgi:hypothetical protein